jgi:hypothetical protein
MVEATVRMIDRNVSYSPVRASRGKVIRAEPVAALYEQRRIHHVGAFPTLEDQMCASLQTSTGAAPAFFASMHWCGRSPSFWSSRCRTRVLHVGEGEGRVVIVAETFGNRLPSTTSPGGTPTYT